MHSLRLLRSAYGLRQWLQHDANGEDCLPCALAHGKEGLPLGAQEACGGKGCRRKAHRPRRALLTQGVLVIAGGRRDRPDEALPALAASRKPNQVTGGRLERGVVGNRRVHGGKVQTQFFFW